MKTHYVYRITNTNINKHYYGVRSCIGNPKEDLGIRYFSSSRDTEFKIDQKENPDSYKYKIIRVYKTRILAVKMEIKLHNKLNVGINESFYNRAKHTSTGFDTTGIPSRLKGGTISKEARAKMSKAKIGEKNAFFGKKHTAEARAKISKAQMGRGLGKIISEETRAKLSKAKNGQNSF